MDFKIQLCNSYDFNFLQKTVIVDTICWLIF